MKTDDIFEALTDIDDKFIASAQPPVYKEDETVVFSPAPRKPLWKTLLPIAACLAVFSTAAVFGARYLMERPDVETSGNSTISGGFVSSLNSGNSQNENVSAVWKQDYEEISVPNISGAKNNEFYMEEFPDYVFTAAYGEVFFRRTEGAEEVGRIQPWDIHNIFLCDLNGDGKRELCVTGLEPDWSKRVYVLDIANNTSYESLQTGSMSKSSYIEAQSGKLALVEEEERGNNQVISVDTLSLSLLTQVIPGSSSAISLEDVSKFSLEEFPDLYFEKKDNLIIMGERRSDAMSSAVISGYDICLADINGDGKRDLCTQNARWMENNLWVQLTVYDIENGETYRYECKTEWGVPFIEIENGKLMLAEYDDRTDTVIRTHVTPDLLHKQEKPEFDEVPLTVDQTFTLPEYEGFTFNVFASGNFPSFNFSWGGGSIGNYAENVFLYDLDGDGKREIIINVVGGFRRVKVYGIRDDGLFGEADYHDSFGCWFRESGGKLVYEVKTSYDDFQEPEIKPFRFTKDIDLSRYVKINIPYELSNWNHVLDGRMGLPSFGVFFCNIYERSMEIKVSGSGEKVFVAFNLDDLYTLNDVKNNTLTYVILKSNGEVIAVELTETTARQYTFDRAVGLKKGDYTLYLVNEDGSEEEFLSVEQGELADEFELASD